MICARRRWWWCLLIVACLVPSAAHAQVFTLTPSISVGTEYNDNIFLQSEKEADVLGTFAPGVNLALESATYRLVLDYSFTSEVYAKHSELDDAVARQQASLAATYRPTAELTLGLTEAYLRGRQTNTVSLLGVSAGFQESWSNALAGNVRWTATPRTTVRFDGSWGIQRFERSGGGTLNEGSDIYRVSGGIDYAFTPRFTGTALYELGVIDVKGGGPENEGVTITNSPRIGGSYRITETLTATANAGPVFVTDHTDTVAAGATATLTQRLAFGSVSIDYDRSVGTAATFGGVTINQTVGGSLVVDRWIKDLTLSLSPRYTTAESTDNDTEDVSAVTVSLVANYRLYRWLGLYASYIFFHQSTSNGNGSSLNGDVDQNRISFGIQVGYPFKLD